MLEPLHPEPWRTSLQGIVDSLATSEEVDDVARLRRLYHLLLLTPPPLQQWFAPSLPENVFELVLRESCQAAALSLIGAAFDLAITYDWHAKSASVTLSLGAARVEVGTHDSSMARAMVRAICEIALQLPES